MLIVQLMDESEFRRALREKQTEEATQARLREERWRVWKAVAVAKGRRSTVMATIPQRTDIETPLLRLISIDESLNQ